MEKTVAQPTPEILAACAELDALIEAYLAARQTALPIGEYESQVEASCLFNLAIRHVQGVVELARRNLNLLPPAIVASRAAFEAAVKAAWLVSVGDPMDGEARWLIHLQSEERYLNRAAHRLRNSGITSESLLSRATQIRTFRLAVDRAMSAGVCRLQRMPTFEQMLGSIGGSLLYTHYIETSQYTHAEHAATWLYRGQGLGTAKELGEFVEPKHWWLPLRLAWLSLTRPAELFLLRIGAPEDAMRELRRDQGIKRQITELHVKAADAVH